jgi:hypothetical protein
MAKQVYLFDSETGIYCGDYLAQECPIVAGDHITPTHSTDIKPPKCKENEYPIFADGKWAKKTIDPVTPIEPPKEDPEKVARYMRDGLLYAVDIAINKFEDCDKDARLLRQHRQALREIPQQSGFPNDIEWPVYPN